MSSILTIDMYFARQKCRKNKPKIGEQHQHQNQRKKKKNRYSVSERFAIFGMSQWSIVQVILFNGKRMKQLAKKELYTHKILYKKRIDAVVASTRDGIARRSRFANEAFFFRFPILSVHIFFFSIYAYQ